MNKLAPFALALALFAPGAAFAVQPDEVLPDPVLEQRARDLSAGLRCMVCQNQSIDDSDAPLARDLRLLVRERLKQGDSDSTVRDYLVARYGDFILLKPPLKPQTWILWATPVIFLLVGGLMARAVLRARAKAPTAKLSDDEQAALDRLMGKNGKA